MTPDQRKQVLKRFDDASLHKRKMTAAKCGNEDVISTETELPSTPFAHGASLHNTKDSRTPARATIYIVRQ